MATITINDLSVNRDLDRQAMSRLRGAGGAPWVYGWITPFSDAPSFAPVVNFYQINNYADQMINQYQMVSVLNTGSNADVAVKVDESSVNNRFQPQ
ncbi:hypothetical protein [Duganella aceris]|jgi:hypothetical protein|uniref:Uncharacterized protein n=1 Tax=Duganella aceris TaxID=2703883 RepID=A0ABX0FKS6_9BURK|nr:hypothetical protein [Duganella aceris]NGZ85130.1 hypothetical protein [Duganella aceris]